MTTYYAFGGYDYYPMGGAGDFIGTYSDELSAVIAQVKTLDLGWMQLATVDDAGQLNIVWES
jgi:hypothetical protein